LYCSGETLAERSSHLLPLLVGPLLLSAVVGAVARTCARRCVAI